MKNPWNEWIYRSRVRRRLRDLCASAEHAQPQRPFQRRTLRLSRHSQPTELREIESTGLGQEVIAAR